MFTRGNDSNGLNARSRNFLTPDHLVLDHASRCKPLRLEVVGFDVIGRSTLELGPLCCSQARLFRPRRENFLSPCEPNVSHATLKSLKSLGAPNRPFRGVV